jgi:hypothetical protein
MTKSAPKSCTAFSTHTRIASGPLAEVALAAKAMIDRDDQASILIFDDATSHAIEVDFRGTPKDVAGRLSSRFTDSEAPRRAGRPKLGVVGREITLLPRHWDWLAQQPGGASVVIRRLIDSERKASGFKDLARQAQETTFRFMNTVAGNFPNYEEVTRALFADDRATFTRLTEQWPSDVRDHARWLMTGGGAASGAEIDR